MGSSTQQQQRHLSPLGAARFFVLLFCMFAATACAAIRGAPELPRPASKAEADSAYLIEPAKLTEYLSIDDPVKKRTSRNEIIDERILEIDTQYRRYEEEMWRERVGGNIAVDWTLLALSGATATIGGEELKAVLGATSTGLMGARESFDKQAFFDATLPALLAQMIAEQAKVKARIAEKKRLSAADYTIYAAQSDLWNLVRAGTIRGILHSIALDAGAKEEVADNELRELVSGSFGRDDASEKLEKFWMPDGDNVDTDNRDKLYKWMERYGLQTGPGTITMFLNTEEMAELRAKAVTELLK